MPDILHDFWINAPADRVFRAISTPEGLDEWWTQHSAGTPAQGADFQLGFGPGYDWAARVTRAVPGEAFELQMTRADADWDGSRVGFELTGSGGGPQVRFHHAGWPSGNEHYRISTYCWAMYLRILKRYLEHGERVPYDKRLDV